jgi:AcrR family transcriptional regulator
MSPRGRKQNEQMRAEALGRITMAALKVFGEYGYHGATMKRITQATGLSYGLVYHYFSSKEAVFRHTVESSLEGSKKATAEILGTPGTAWEKIERLSAFLVGEALAGESSLYFLVVLQAMTQVKSLSDFHSRVIESVEAYYEILSPYILEAQESGEAVQGDPLVLAAAYFSFVQGLALLGVQGNGLMDKITPEILLGVLRRKG